MVLVYYTSFKYANNKVTFFYQSCVFIFCSSSQTRPWIFKKQASAFHIKLVATNILTKRKSHIHFHILVNTTYTSGKQMYCSHLWILYWCEKAHCTPVSRFFQPLSFRFFPANLRFAKILGWRFFVLYWSLFFYIFLSKMNNNLKWAK